MEQSAITPFPGNRKKDSSVQVLQVHKASFIGGQEEDYLSEGIYVCHAPLTQTLKDETWINNTQIDAVVVGPDCSVSDIVSIREIATREVVPLVIHTLKFDWKAKEIALESGVDEYHIGFLDQHFIKRIRLIKRIKSLLNTKQGKKNKRLSGEGQPSNLWLAKRSFDIAVAVLTILLLLPVLLVIVPLLALETEGPMLSKSKRVGKNYRAFDLYKFSCISSGDSQKINLIRHFLQKAHLVGLPQLLNVLAGDMSLVGNYPVLENDAEKLTKDRIAWRFLAPVGIVGLWRFNHSKENKTDAWDCTKPDMEYAMTNSIWLDMKILFFHFLNLVVAKHNQKKEWVQRNLSWDMLMSNYISKDQKDFNVVPN